MLSIRQPGTAQISAFLVIIASLLGGCSKNSSDGTASPANPDPPNSVSSTSTPLALTGTPAGSVVAGSSYSFQPSVSQSGGSVTFSITGQPSWATFSDSTGELTGTPTESAVGTSATVTITANNGSSTASVGPFTITVVAATTDNQGGLTLSWMPPDESTAGGPVPELAGYYIYYGKSADALTQSIMVYGGETTSYVIANLPSGTYYFSVSTLSAQGIQGPQSDVVSTTI
jgi:Putative Ig domain